MWELIEEINCPNVTILRYSRPGFGGITTTNFTVVGRTRSDAFRNAENRMASYAGIPLPQQIEELQRAIDAHIVTATMELRSLSHKLLTGQEEERRFLAHELHEEIGQLLAGLSFSLSAGAYMEADQLAEARRIVAHLTEQVRELSGGLRPAVLDDYGLLAAVRWHVDRCRGHAEVQIDVKESGLDRRFPSSIEVAAFRIVQEALANAMHYADVQAVTVLLVADAECLEIRIQDDGRGFGASRRPDGEGIGGMRARAELLGGTLDVLTHPGAGTTIAVALPLDGSGAGD